MTPDTLEVGRRPHREQLYGRVQALLSELDDDATQEQINEYLEARVREDSALFAIAQSAGGCWLVQGSGLVFAAW